MVHRYPCHTHYLDMYYRTQQSNPCDSCKAKPRKGEQFGRHCPSPDIINGYLNLVSNEPRNLTSNSTICLPCYKYFSGIVKQVQQANANQPPSIEDVLTTILQKQHLLNNKGSDMLYSKYLELIACLTAHKLANALRNDEAMLLPAVHQSFTNEAYNQSANFPSVGVAAPGDVPGTRWLLSRLHSFFGSSIEVQCKHKRFGSVIFHKECNLVKAMSTALGKAQSLERKMGSLSSSSSCMSEPPAVPTLEEKINEAAVYTNIKLHEQAKVLITEFRDSPSRYCNLNLSDFINNLDPYLLNFLQKLTQSVRSQKKFHTVFDTHSTTLSATQIRQVYAICVLLFCTNNLCSMPLHVLLTESVLCHGGSLELVKVLNRVGAVASFDTCNRLATRVVQQQILRGIKPELSPNTLTVVSIDNIDILQSHAMVSSVDATRSWHGTSVQCVQPLPASGTLSNAEVIHASNTSRKHVAFSPIPSPIPMERCKRCRRTLAELASPHTNMANPVGLLSHCGELSLDDIDTTDYPSSRPNISITNFLPNAEEKCSMTYLHEGLFCCIVLKGAQSHQECSVLPGISSLLNCIQQQKEDKEVSNVVYVSEKADCKGHPYKSGGKPVPHFCPSAEAEVGHCRW